MKKSQITRLAAGLLILLWLGVMFGFSAQNGDTSGQLSGTVVDSVLRILHPDLEAMEPEARTELFDTWQFIIRKTAHFTEYAILAVFLSLFSFTYEGGKKRKIILILLFIILCASGDEFHQKFVDGRGPSLRDVGIDTAGGAAGTALAFLIRHRTRRNTSKDGSRKCSQ